MTLSKDWKDLPASELKKVRSLRLEQLALGKQLKALTNEIQERHDINMAAFKYATLKKLEFEALSFEVDAIFKKFEDQ